jgi:hypothetical protein
MPRRARHLVLPLLVAAGCGSLDPEAARSALAGGPTADAPAPVPWGLLADPNREGVGWNHPVPWRGLASAPLGFGGEPEPGHLAVTLTDAPGDFEAVPVTIGWVSLCHMVDDDGAEDEGDTGADTGADAGADTGADTGAVPQRCEWMLITDTPTEWDLLALQDGVTGLLGTSELAPGSYGQLRLQVLEAAVVIDGETIPMTIPSGAQTGIKVQTDVTIASGETHELRLDFDAHESIRLVRDTYRMQPVIKQVYFGEPESPAAVEGGDDGEGTEDETEASTDTGAQ